MAVPAYPIPWFTTVESLGIFSFGLNAAIVAYAKGCSPLGVVLITAASAMGGSTMRDLLLGPEALPFVWAKSPALLLTTLCLSLSYALLAPVREMIDRRDFYVRETAEALAFASLTALGAAKATTLLAPIVPPDAWAGLALPMLAGVVGMIGSTSGLILRDMLLGDRPSALTIGAGVLEPVLATAMTVAGLLAIGVRQPWAILAGFVVALAMRLPAMWRRRPQRCVKPT